ncbi:predicted protein, partial [Nematostella vectensis]
WDYEFKTLIIGNSGVGKSCLVNKLKNPHFDLKFVTSTVGMNDIFWEYFLYDNKKIKLTIGDTAGQERYFSILPAYFRGVQGVFLVFEFNS